MRGGRDDRDRANERDRDRDRDPDKNDREDHPRVSEFTLCWASLWFMLCCFMYVMKTGFVGSSLLGQFAKGCPVVVVGGLFVQIAGEGGFERLRARRPV